MNLAVHGTQSPDHLAGAVRISCRWIPPLDSLAAPQLVAVPAGHVKWPFIAEIPWLTLLPRALCASWGISCVGFDLNRCPVDVRLRHHVLLVLITFVHGEGPGCAGVVAGCCSSIATRPWFHLPLLLGESQGLALVNGRDAADVAMFNQFGPALYLRAMEVLVEMLDDGPRSNWESTADRQRKWDKLGVIGIVEPFQFLVPPSIRLVPLDPASHSFFTNLNEAFR